MRGGKRDLGIDGLLAQGLHCAGIAAQIDAVLGVNLIERYGEQKVVDVVAAKVRVSISGLDFKDAVA